MAFEKITEEELASVGVENLPDRPALQPQEAKEKFEETAKKLLAPKINKLIEALIDVTAAAQIGAEVPEKLPEETEKNVQAVLQAVLDKVLEHEGKKDNPHEVKAEQTGAYTKEETNQALDDKMKAIGAGDMAKSIYDPQGRKRDIFHYAEMPVGFLFEWLPVAGQQTDLSTPEKVAAYFGYGTWQEITGRFLYGRSGSHQPGSTGGAETVALTADQNGPHNHVVSRGFYNTPGNLGIPGGVFKGNYDAAETWSIHYTENSGAGQPHNNLPPYLAVYIWQRIA